MSELAGELFQNERLEKYTSWRVGGPAKTLYKPRSIQDCANFLASLPEDENILWLGLGSNTLIRDNGYDGTVIITQGLMGNLSVERDNVIRAEAGVSCAQLARFTARHSLADLEFMAGIPGTVGGALNMNAGCFNGETWDHVVSVEVITRDGDIQTRTPNDFNVAYRSVMPKNLDNRCWFIAGTFQLKSGSKQTSLETIKQLLDRRAQTQPTGDHSCGSVFRNPPNDFAGRLIEACGLKGHRHGGAQISEKHANFIINADNATARDIEELIELVHATVLEKFEIDLHRECHIFGEVE